MIVYTTEQTPAAHSQAIRGANQLCRLRFPASGCGRYGWLALVQSWLLFGMLSNGGATAQPIRNEFKHLSVADGLSHNAVNCILQDRDGFLWFGTNDGLNRYDGYTFTVFQPDPDNPTHSFQNNRIMGLCEDHQNRFWVVTEGGGLHEVNKKTGQVTPHLIRAEKANRWNSQLSVYEDSQGTLWISTYDGIVRYEPAAHRFTLYPAPQREMQIKSVFEDRYHRFWAATSQGLYTFDRQTGRFTLVSLPTQTGFQPVFNSFYADAQDVLWLGTAGDGLFQIDLHSQSLRPVPYNPGGQINRYLYLNAIYHDAQGVLWLATTDGLQRVNPKTNQVSTYRPSPTVPHGISSTNAQAVFHDRAGVLWVGTNNGIDQQAVNTKPFGTYQIKPNAGSANLPENKVNNLVLDGENRLWLSNQRTVYRVDAGQSLPEQVSPLALGTADSYENHTFSMLADKSGGVWLGTWKGLYRFDPVLNRYTGYPSEVPTQFISRGPAGHIWAGGEGGIASFNTRTRQYTYYKYNPADTSGLPDKFVYALLASRMGDVWVAVNGKGISRLNPRTGRFTQYTASLQAGRLNNNEVLAFYEDANGIIWLGTNQGGLNQFDPRTGLFTHITTRNGLPSNRIVGITGDAAGYLWLSTNRGLCRFDTRTKAIRHYDTNDGLPSNDFLENAVLRHGNRLYFGSLNGLVFFNPDSIRADRRPFPVALTGFKVMDKSRPLTDSVISLRHNENFLSFEFAALTYVMPEQNQYAYQLVGIDNDWVQNGNRRFINYTNLPPGHYTFRVKASNHDDIWNRRGASVKLVIHPPWWATGWAYALYALLFGGAIWAGVRFYTNRIRQRQEQALNRREAEQLKAVDELKTSFFSNITHEFRTPLSLILVPVSKLLEDTRFDASTRRNLSIIQRNARQLLLLINQLLDLSKLEANHMAVVLMQGRVVEFVEQVIESFQPMADQKAVTLLYEAEASEQEHRFDADKWQKILSNLLSNAVKFTEAGGWVTVTLTTIQSATPEQTTVMQVVVADTGAGISPESLPHIFNRFYQADDSPTRAYEGTGIGLALANELTGLLGGLLTARSQPNIGTTFTLTLPVLPALPGAETPVTLLLEREPPDSYLPPDEEPGTPGLSLPDDPDKPVILVVEDSAELREFVAGELARFYRVLSAADGEEGWALVQVELPDVVLSDVMMPRLDGYELTRLIKTNPATDHIAVVLLTAKAAQPSRIEGLQEGADDYLTKPFDFGELHLRLRNLLTRQQRLREQYRRQLDQPDAPGEPDVVLNPFLPQIYELLDNHLGDPLLNVDVDWLADQLAMSRKTLQRKVQSLLQLSPSDLIRQYRLRKAVDLLRAGRNVSETAYAVGFKTPAHFSTVFKDFYGKTPTEFTAGNK